uniref:GOLD domain-containing protein n=1 Tax=Strongyloides stercoralis TaxID=6248 RepID=A0A0K0DTI8_STRER
MWRPIEPKEWSRTFQKNKSENSNIVEVKDLSDYNEISLLQDIQNISLLSINDKKEIETELDPWKIIRLLFMLNLIQFVIFIGLLWYIRRRNRFFFKHFIKNQQ